MGSSKKQTVSYWYHPTFQMVLHEGPFDKLLEIRGGDVTAWKGEMTASGSIQIDAANIWGGEEKEGGIQGTVDVSFGEMDAQPNAYFQTAIGADPSGHNGYALLQFNGGRYGAGNPYPKPISVLTERLYQGWLDDACWYPEKVAVPVLDGAVTLLGNGWEYQLELFDEPNTVWNNFETPEEGWLQGGELPYVTGGPYWTPMRSNIWVRRRIQVNGTGLTLNIAAENGCAVWVDGEFIGSNNPENIPIPNNENNPVSYPINKWGTLEVVVKAYAEINAVNDAGNVLVMSITGDSMAGMNPAHVIYDSLVYLQGEPVGMIDEASFRAAADTLYAEGFGICTKYDHDRESIDQFRQRMLDLIGAECSRYNGRWYLDLIRPLGDEAIAALPVLGDDDILDWEEDVATIDDMVNQVSVKWFDPLTKQERVTAPVHALAAINAMGAVSAEIKQYLEVPYENLANRLAARDLQNKSTPTRRLRLTTNRRPYIWRKGHAFRLQAPKRGISDMVCRVAEIDRGTLQSGAIRLVAVQDVFSMPSTAYVLGQPPVPPASQEPKAIQHQVLFEAPYVELAGSLSQADLAAMDADAGYIVAAASRPGAGVGYALLTRPSGGEFDRIGIFDWCPSAVVVEGAGVTETEFTLASGSYLDRVDVGTAALWGDELVRVDAAPDPGTGAVTLARGCGDTVPQRHAPGELIYFFDAWSSTDRVEYAAAETVEAKLLPRTGTQELSESAATLLSVTMDQRAARPYPPGDFKINGDPDPDPETPITAALEVTWAHRDRVQQADQLVDTTVGDVGPEDGVSYTVEYYTEQGTTPVDSETAINGTASTPWVAPSSGKYRVELFSVRDGLESWQRHSRVILIGAEPWTPAMLSVQPAVWMDWDSAVTVVSGAASEWSNSKGSIGGDFSQATSANRPTIVASDPDIAVRVLSFNGTTAWLRQQSTAAGNIFRQVGAGWAFAVVKKRGADLSGTTRVLVYSPRSTDGATRFQVAVGRPDAPNSNALLVKRLDADSTSQLNGSVTPGDWIIRCDIMDWSQGAGFIYVNGALDASNTSLTTSGDTSDTAAFNNRLSIGADASTATPGGNADVDLACLIVGSGSLPSIAERQRLEGWAAWATGLQDNLAAAHPFRYAMPYVQTPVLQPSFATDPVVIGFVAEDSGSDVGVASGPAIGAPFGVLLEPTPALGLGEGLTVSSDGDDIYVRLDGLAPPAQPAQAKIMDHQGGLIAVVPLTDQTGYSDGAAAGSLEDGQVYYVRIEEA